MIDKINSLLLNFKLSITSRGKRGFNLFIDGRRLSNFETICMKCPSCFNVMQKSGRAIRNMVIKNALISCNSCTTKKSNTVEVKQKISNGLKEAFKRSDVRENHRKSRNCMQLDSVKKKISDAIYEKYKDEKYQNAQRNGQNKRWLSVDERNKRSVISKKLMENKELRNQISQSLLFRYENDPSLNVLISELTKKGMESCEVRELCSKGGKNAWKHSREIITKKVKDACIRNWAKPDFRKRMLEILKRSKSRISKGQKELYCLLLGFCPGLKLEELIDFGDTLLSLDICDINSKTSIEYCGDYWHKGLYNRYFSINNSDLKTTQKNAYKNDLKREAILLSRGWKIVYVFESFWKKNKEIVVKNIRDVISGIINPVYYMIG